MRLSSKTVLRRPHAEGGVSIDNQHKLEQMHVMSGTGGNSPVRGELAGRAPSSVVGDTKLCSGDIGHILCLTG